MNAPFRWTKKIEAEICGLLASGSSIREIGRRKGFPSEPTIYRRMAIDSEFAESIAEARTAQQDYEVDRCIEMADEATTEDWQVVKLRIWARQWRAAKLAPKKYGERTSIEHSGKLSLEGLIAASNDDTD